jgi:hypothetical protein
MSRKREGENDEIITRASAGTASGVAPAAALAVLCSDLFAPLIVLDAARVRGTRDTVDGQESGRQQSDGAEPGER